MQVRFDSAAEAILSETNPNAFRGLSSELCATLETSNPDRWLDLYTRAGTLQLKAEFAKLIWLFFREQEEREKGFFFVLDVLNLQLSDARLRTILKNHPLLSPFNLNSAECDVVVAVLLGFLEEHPPTDWNAVGERYGYQYISELPNNEFAARLLTVLYEYPATSRETKKRIDSQRDLAVLYTIVDHDHYYFDLRTINDYLNQRIY